MTGHGVEPLLDVTLRVDTVPTAGRTLAVEATDEQRAAIAERLEVTSVETLSAAMTATPFKGGIRVLGRLQARIVQPCVVTFEPVTQDIDEPMDRVFLPRGEKSFATAADAEVFVDVEGEDLPDHFEGGEADLSEFIIETLALAVDPYPRAPGASLDGLVLGDDDKDESPFARLKVLKEGGDKP